MQPEKKKVLQSFYKKTQPGGPGWTKIINEALNENITLQENESPWSVPSGILAMLLGCVLIYSCLFTTGYWIYGEYKIAVITSLLAIISGFLLVKMWKKIRVDIL